MSDSIATQINPDSRVLATILTTSSRGIAADAAWQLLGGQPVAKEGFGADPFTGWKHWLAARVEELASAIAFGRFELRRSSAFGAVALGPRGIDSAHFRQGLVCLRGVLLEELPAKVRAIAAAYVDRALETSMPPERKRRPSRLARSRFGVWSPST